MPSGHARQVRKLRRLDAAVADEFAETGESHSPPSRRSNWWVVAAFDREVVTVLPDATDERQAVTVYPPADGGC